MPTLTAWRFDTAAAAGVVAARLEALDRDDLTAVVEAISVAWDDGTEVPATRRLRGLSGTGVVDRVVAAVLAGAASAETPVEPEFAATVRARVQPGTSALFLLSAGPMTDTVRAAFDGMHAEVVRSNVDIDGG